MLVGGAVVGADDQLAFGIGEVCARVGNDAVGSEAVSGAAEIADDAVGRHVGAERHFLKTLDGWIIRIELGDGDLSVAKQGECVRSEDAGFATGEEFGGEEGSFEDTSRGPDHLSGDPFQRAFRQAASLVGGGEEDDSPWPRDGFVEE